MASKVESSEAIDRRGSEDEEGAIYFEEANEEREVRFCKRKLICTLSFAHL